MRLGLQRRGCWRYQISASAGHAGYSPTVRPRPGTACRLPPREPVAVPDAHQFFIWCSFYKHFHLLYVHVMHFMYVSVPIASLTSCIPCTYSHDSVYLLFPANMRIWVPCVLSVGRPIYPTWGTDGHDHMGSIKVWPRFPYGSNMGHEMWCLHGV